MLFSFLNKNKNKIIAVLDIGSDSVGVAIVEIHNNPAFSPNIIKSIRRDFPYTENVNIDLLIESMLKELKLACNHILNMGLSSPVDIYVVLSSPWYTSDARRVFIKEENPFVVSEKIMNQRLDKEFLDFHSNYILSNKLKQDDASFVDREIVQVSLNGYVSHDPIGKKTNSIEMDVVLTFAPSFIIKKISKVVESVFHRSPKKFCSCMSSLYMVIREKYPEMNSYIIVDIGGELTDVGVVYDGILRNLVSFPFGRQKFLRILKNKLNKSAKEVKSIFSLYSHGSLEKKESDFVNKVILSTEDLWVNDFISALSIIPESQIMPASLFVVTNREMKSWLPRSFAGKNEELHKFLRNDVAIVPIGGVDFMDVCKVQSGGCDSVLMAQSISIQKKCNFKYD